MNQTTQPAPEKRADDQTHETEPTLIERGDVLKVTEGCFWGGAVDGADITTRKC